MSNNKFDESKAQEECTKVIQALMDSCHFYVPVDAGKALGHLIMQATTALDAVMGPEYAAQTLLKVMESMNTGEPQKRAKVEMIQRSKLN